MDGLWMRNGAIGCAIACGVMIAGPGIAGSAVASAGLLGIGGGDGILDIFGDDDTKRSARHPSPADAGASSRGTADAGPPTSTIGVTRVDAGGQPTATFGGEATSVGGGGGGVPQFGGADRAANLPPVSTAPSTREIVIRAEPPAAVGVGAPPAAPVPEFVPPMPPAIVAPAIVLPPVPVVVPPALPGGPGAPAGRPEPPASPIPVTQQPRANNPLAPPESFGPNPMPDSFRVGYPEYLRAATVADLMVVVLPGVAGMTLFTVAGGVLGFRQARAVQAASLLTPAAARFVQ